MGWMSSWVGVQGAAKAVVLDGLGLLDVSGEPPAEFAGIRDQLLGEQEEDGGEDSPSDYLHDIPLDLAKSVCGYRADESEAVFVALKRIGAAPAAKPAARGSAEPRPKRSFLARLLGR